MPQAFQHSSVRLLPGPVQARQSVTARYLLELEPDRLLHNFRVNAGLASSARPLGGWESPACQLRGHFVGHYVSACASMFAATGEARFRERVHVMVAGLEECQRALGGGYLAAFPESAFDTLEREFRTVWAPYYTLHKVLAGLIDAHRDAGSGTALAMAGALGDWVARRLRRLPEATLEPMLRTDGDNPLNEYGGIGESLYDLYELTRDEAHLRAAQEFDREWFLRPLIDGRDELAGLHVNTHLAQGLAAVRRYELTGATRYRLAAERLWELTAQARSYVNGGSSGPRHDRNERTGGGEHWPDAHRLAGTLTSRINESCVAHHMVRLSDALFRNSPEPRYAEFRERAYWNSVLGMQHPGYAGGYIYNQPLSSASRKVYSDAEDTFWCCCGSSVDAYARLADGIYFHDEQSMWVCQFVPSEVTWETRGVRLTQHTEFPYGEDTRLTVHASAPSEFTLKLRVPAWSGAAACSVNGETIDAPSRGFANITRRWRDGDTLRLTLPMSLRTEPLHGSNSEIAFLYGPIVMAGRTAHGLEVPRSVADPLTLVREVNPSRLEFRVRLFIGADATMVPLHEIVDEPFGVYFKILN